MIATCAWCPTCLGVNGCQKCDEKRLAALVKKTGDWMAGLGGGMIVCPTCGNKRCPKATFHGNDCTVSNAPNQPGSSYQICCCEWSDEWLDEMPSKINPACTVEDHKESK